MQNIQAPKRQFHFTPEELKSFQKNGYAGPFTIYEPDEMKAIWRRQRLQLLDRRMAIYRSARPFRVLLISLTTTVILIPRS